jgi:hypothetical protein
MDGQPRAAALRFWEQQVRSHGDLVRGAVEAIEHFAGEGEGGFEALKVALIEEAARRIACAALRRRTG